METIVSFHTGRGGRFYNAGHTKFVGNNPISYYTNELSLYYENQMEIFFKIQGRENLTELYYLAIDEYSDNEYKTKFEARTGLKFGELAWYHNGNPVGLTLKESETGIGCIDIDGQYGTTASKYLKDCTENEIRIIEESDYWNCESLIKEWETLNNTTYERV